MALHIEIELGSRSVALPGRPGMDALHTPFLVQASGTTLTLKEETWIKIIDTTYYIIGTATDETFAVADKLDTGSIAAGTDYYVYVCTDGEIVVSLNSSYPDGYTADNSRKIGGFHTLCVNAGTISGHTLTGYTAGQILPASVWCLNWRPTNLKPEGMAYVSALNGWYDIYMPSGTGVNTLSKFGATITDTRTWDDMNDDLAAAGKRMLTDAEFSVAAAGSNALTSIAGSAKPSPCTAGGHSDTVGRRMVSNYGLEDCCGLLNQWLQNNVYRHDNDSNLTYSNSGAVTITHAASPGGNPIYLKYSSDGTPYLCCNMATDAVDKIITFGSAYTLRIIHDADAATGSYQVYFDEDATGSPNRLLCAVPGLKSEVLRTSASNMFIRVVYHATPSSVGVAVYFDDGADQRLEFISPTATNGTLDVGYVAYPALSYQALGSLGSIYKQGGSGQGVMLVAGGIYNGGSVNGPRSRSGIYSRWTLSTTISTRGCCGHRTN